jgi:hypothetical protein
VTCAPLDYAQAATIGAIFLMVALICVSLFRGMK